MEEIKSFFTSRGLGTSELAKGLVIHEVPSSFQTASEYGKITYQVLGVAILVSAWGGCYFLRPSARSLPLHFETRNKMRKWSWSVYQKYFPIGLWLSSKTRTTSNGNKHKRGSLCPPSPAEYQGMNTESLPIISYFSWRLVPQGKAAAVGLAFGESVFLRKLFMPILVGGFFDSHCLKKYSALLLA